MEGEKEGLSMKAMEKQQKKRRLAYLQQELKETKETLSDLRKELNHEEQRGYILKLIHAGMVIEEAGLLDSYDPDELYFWLKENQDKLTKKATPSRYGGYEEGRKEV